MLNLTIKGFVLLKASPNRLRKSSIQMSRWEGERERIKW